jgi:hypothetical protein
LLDPTCGEVRIYNEIPIFARPSQRGFKITGPTGTLELQVALVREAWDALGAWYRIGSEVLDAPMGSDDRRGLGGRRHGLR